ncbi:MAG: ABC transporter permease subunit [Anaerolineae bacterium]|nr:ABC transporter permease subunit [Anaerolineae bacterium]
MSELAIDRRTVNPSPGLLSGFRLFIAREGFGLVALVFMTVFILGPISSVVLWAFAEGWEYPSLVPTTWGFKYWADTFERADIQTALPTSILLSITVTAISAAICFPAAYAFARMKFAGRQPLLLSFLVTNAFPRFGLYVSIAVVFFRLNLVGTFPGVVLIQLVNTLLIMIWIPTAAFQGIDRALEEAGLDVGASRLQVFLRITLPLALPALSAALLLTFFNTFYESQGALIIGLPNVRTLPVLMFSLINGQIVVQYGAILSLILWLPSLVSLVFAQRLLRGGYLTAGFGV